MKSPGNIEREVVPKSGIQRIIDEARTKATEALGVLPNVENIKQTGLDALEIGGKIVKETVKTPFALIPGVKAFGRNYWSRLIENSVKFPVDILKNWKLGPSAILLGPAIEGTKRFASDAWNSVKPERLKGPRGLKGLVNKLSPLKRMFGTEGMKI